ncbi:DNA-binding transcriptional ArsR family regulator [Bacillus tianshenii]|uniref:DNA-binding transcriptional ArsR family regulator n=1 Tax=Sutcliffiella tianshenii TaxID=1463404 RepID=A0ABS2P3K4_9BACI|nr:metalloregulator ArsR/SmtB family transcription factor [Bacillus tianshenii]MBM7621510.1 DNA-binding transcriptional ArsR family regulator [Bacillus tianshenii]MCA1319198.1 metalloregulator ArsR/SmtB family transcription factor [Bacillus tianshenii]
MNQRAIQTFRDCIPLFQVLADEARQDIILLLAEQESLTVNEIAESSRLSRPAISHHLKILRDNKLVSIEQKGTQRIYSLTLDTSVLMLKNLIELVEEECL